MRKSLGKKSLRKNNRVIKSELIRHDQTILLQTTVGHVVHVIFITLPANNEFYITLGEVCTIDKNQVLLICT